MAKDRRRRPSSADDEGAAVLDEIQRVLDTPLAEFVTSDVERAEAEELTGQAATVPAIRRFREIVAFVGTGRRGTQSGNLRAADAVALARRLGTKDDLSGDVRSMADLPETAHAFRWAMAAEFLALRGSTIVPGLSAGDLERDALPAWFKAALTLLGHGVLDGFQEGWRKQYVEFLDASVASLLAAIAEAGGVASLSEIGERAWELVAAEYGFDLGDEAERRRVVRLVRGMLARLADVGTVDVFDDDDRVALTGLGHMLAVVATLESDDDPDDLDLEEIDAESLLLLCAEEPDPADATDYLRAWCEARPADEAADELAEAMVDLSDPDVWRLGLEALAMIDPQVARPVVERLSSQPGVRTLATKWLRRHGTKPGRPGRR